MQMNSSSTDKITDPLYAMRHSLAHILADAIQKKWPSAKFGVGPVIADGFYYDVDLGDIKISTDNFPAIEKEMRNIIKANSDFIKSEKTIEDAIKWAKTTKQPYKEELLNDLKRSGTTLIGNLDVNELGLASDDAKVDKVSFYTNDNFEDLCRGPHVTSTGAVGVFKLTKIAGAYWRGQEDKPQMQRVYGVAFSTQEELDEYIKMQEEAKRRDHRKVGQDLDLFLFSELVGQGLPLFTPRGTILRDEIVKFSNELRLDNGFEKVWIPHMTKNELYKKSGHWDKFGEELFLVKSQETSDELVLKPMNCPHHTQIYASKQRSYRDLPVRYLETTTVYRDEKSGELGGLSRVRSITQDDSHIFCRTDQIEAEIANMLAAAKTLYSTVDMKLRVRLSYRDSSDGYLGEQSKWDDAQKQLKAAVTKNKLEFFEVEGEAAFYGPKIDFMATDAIGREHQVATVQLDFVQPERFGLEYTNKEGVVESPVMVHCALLGSIERFLSVYIEHTEGRFPVWLAPEQIRLITVNQTDEIVQFCEKIIEKAKVYNLRVKVDNSNESVGKKIRNSEKMKIPYVCVIGEQELRTEHTIPRIRGDLGKQTENKVLISKFFELVSGEAVSRADKTSL
jgi:threonyl-tRNA synthetase